MRYVELRWDVPAALAERVGQVLVDVGAGGIEERDASTIDRPARGVVALLTWVAPEEVDAFVSRATARLAELLGPDAARPARRDRDEDEWRDAWKRYFHARPVGRFVIVPSWERHAPTADQIVLDLDPGRAFGTGGHASTRLCLLALSELDLAPTRVVDVGCGSGVLAIAAAKRWPALTGEGVDVDPDAVEVSRENAERNGVAARLGFSTRALERVDGGASIVLANIQPEVLIPMASALVGKLAPAGALVLAGIVDEAAEDVVTAYAAAGLAPPRRLCEEGWTALVYRRGGA